MKHIQQIISRSKRSSTRAIKQFVTTEEELKQANKEVDKALESIEKESERLQELKANGEILRAENEGIIDRIGQIVRGSSE